MGYLRLLVGVLVFAGCVESSLHTPTEFKGDGAGSTTTTAGSGGGQLLDGEGGEQPACCVKDKTAPFEGPSWFVITGDRPGPVEEPDSRPTSKKK